MTHFRQQYMLLIFTFLLAGTSLNANSYDSKVSEVVVYRNKAKETRTLKISVKETGKQEIVLTNISTQIDPSSLQVSLVGATLLSASTKLNYLTPKKNTQQLQTWKDSLDLEVSNLAWLIEQIAVYQGELNMLNNLKVDGDETSAYVKTADDLSNLYRTKALKARENIFALQKKEKALNQVVQNLRQQIASLGNNTQVPVQEIILVVDVPKATELQIKCQYLVNGASWEPAYNLRATGLNQPIQLEMMATVRQSSGLDWENVQLSLSTTNPTNNQSRPVMTTEFVDYYQQVLMEVQEISRYKTNAAYAAPKSLSRMEADGVDDSYPIEAEETTTAQLYTFKTKQDVKSNKEAQQIVLNTMSMPAEFIYHTVPKKDLTAFLIAKVPQWEKFNLLAGKASIFFEDAYIGQTQINPKVASDTLLLSMGRDELITVERQSVKDLTSNKWLGNSQKEVKTFEIKVKNNKKADVKIEVLDQIPVSRQKDIEVVLESQDGAEYLTEIGRLKWILNLKPGESRTLKFSYSIKYPGGKEIRLGN